MVTPLRFRENYVQKMYDSSKETLSEAFKYVQEYHFPLLMTVYYRAADVALAKQIRQTTEVTLIPREKLKERKEILEQKEHVVFTGSYLSECNNSCLTAGGSPSCVWPWGGFSTKSVTSISFHMKTILPFLLKNLDILWRNYSVKYSMYGPTVYKTLKNRIP